MPIDIEAMKSWMATLPREACASISEIESKIIDPYGAILERDSGKVEEHIFVTKFEAGDVEDFINLLKERIGSPQQYEANSISRILENELRKWEEYFGVCPYEPFLWALKSQDNYIGSLANNAVPQPWLMDMITLPLKNIWNDINDEYKQVVKNVLNYWEWYQPVQVVLSLYKSLPQYDDPELNRRISEYWLKRAPYYRTAFDCLLKKKKDEANIYSIMSFVSQDLQRDIYNAEMPITIKMREHVKEYFVNASEDVNSIGAQYYRNVLHNCTKKARRLFDELWNKKPIDEVEEFIKSFEKGTAPDAELLRLLTDQSTNQLLIEKAAERRNESLVRRILQKIDDIDEYSFQFCIMGVMQNAATCDTYINYILEKYRSLSPQVRDKDLVIMSAYCFIYGADRLNDIFDCLYIKGIGKENARFAVNPLRIKYSRQTNSYFEDLVKKCKDDIDLSMKVIDNSRVIHTKNENSYPVSLDKVCDKLVALALEKPEESTASRYLSTTLALFDVIVNGLNKARYERNLYAICGMTPSSTGMRQCQSWAEKILRTIFRGAAI